MTPLEKLKEVDKCLEQARKYRLKAEEKLQRAKELLYGEGGQHE